MGQDREDGDSEMDGVYHSAKGIYVETIFFVVKLCAAYFNFSILKEPIP